MEKHSLRIGIITASDPLVRRSWSGIYYHMCMALQEEFATVLHLGPIRQSSISRLLMNFRTIILSLYYKYFLNKKYSRNFKHSQSKYSGRYFRKMLEENRVDVLYAPTGSTNIAHLETDLPICYASDTTFRIICNYYDSFKSLSDKAKQIGDELEQKAINKSTTQVFHSQWALNSAKEHYGAQNAYLVKLGANIDKNPVRDEIYKDYQ